MNSIYKNLREELELESIESNLVRKQFNITEETSQTIKDLKTVMKTNNSSVLSTAISVLEIIVIANRKNHKILIVDENGASKEIEVRV